MPSSNKVRKVTSENYPTDDELTDELRYKWSFCPIVTKEKEGYVSMFVPGGNVIRFKDKEATQLIFDAIMRSFDRV